MDLEGDVAGRAEEVGDGVGVVVRCLQGGQVGVELQWLLGADINLPGLVTTHLDQAITRWKAAPAT